MKATIWPIVFLVSCASAGTPPPKPIGQSPKQDDVSLLASKLCDKKVVLLGEPGNHGNANMVTIRAAIVEKLVNDCGFDTIFFEAGIYDFLKIQTQLESGIPVDQPTLAAALGPFFASEEMKHLVTFLVARLNERALQVNGIDDNIGRGSYAQTKMAKELVRLLPAEKQAECAAILDRDMTWSYDREHPQSVESEDRILACLQEISLQSNRTDVADKPALSQMLESASQFYRRRRLMLAEPKTFDDGTGESMRDRSMFANFQWAMARSKASRKVIVWTATVHAAKDLSRVESHRNFAPFGSFLHEAYGASSFVLGFSAFSGSYTVGTRPPVKPISDATPDFVESRALEGVSSAGAYVDRERLRAMGSVNGRLLRHEGAKAPWDTLVDGLYVFREEHPPAALPKPGAP